MDPIHPKRLREMRRHLDRENRRYGPEPVQVPRDQWAQGTFAGVGPDALWRSRNFLIQVFKEDQGAMRLSICRTQLDKHGQYVDGISWEELQGLKNLCGFAEREAIEIYPISGNEVNVANFRHLWVMPSWMRLHWTWKHKG